MNRSLFDIVLEAESNRILNTQPFINVKKLGINLKLIMTLSEEKYEKAECYGFLTFVDHSYDLTDMDVEFAESYEYDIAEVRNIRKFIETTSEDYQLIVCDNKIIGIGKVLNATLKVNIIIKGAKRITITSENEEAHFINDQYITNYFDNKKIEFTEKFKSVFNKYPCISVCDIYDEVTQQNRGTTLIILDKAKADYEANRLSGVNRGTKIKYNKKKQNKALLRGLTSIDGAMIIDEYGYCYGIGYILDGKAIVKGRNERGARYNSANNYIAIQKDGNEGKGIAVIVSEDKGIDIIFTDDDFIRS